MKRIVILILTGFFSINNALAEDAQVVPTSDMRELSPTRQWLELQRSGKASSRQAQPISGEIMDKVHQRYLKSFERPIPEFYEHEVPAAR